ncbi:MAG TPA: DNA alkylation repair protein [Burkholderiales bacterium]|nr:DNA alkylation repair protein [Burkholderiales bacterium]
MPTRKVPPHALAREAVRRLNAGADPMKAEGTQRYFKETVKAYGLRAADVRALAAELYGSVKGAWRVADAVALCDILFAAPELESKAVGALVLCRFKKDFPPSFPAKVKAWLAADLLDNWASVDVFCGEAMGAFLADHPDSTAEVKSWAFHPNRWVKRASAVSFIKLARRKEFQDAIYAVAASLFPVDDDLIHKATGWLLREAGKRDPKRLAAFLLEHGRSVPRTALRYAIERFPEAERKALLTRTK